ncbi:BN860_03202g1_1 [Zygosaccharomyces bailii CLIB 213]|uniref:BN860_03202g1_1 n=1 Tax=Zygosaccharomyces bailii (strain CLIB 213 / ATCC 58445 / CBS 680 / BCRC 21525 / NBRC 1098 / NCYC 1416 / NRRL Y-2227) TaxID=1333698 RepID=A0A8J2T480_ZYGB2|nr:BN860_03202g1_1 [Zygosaccharomyces bailii CLIB 213]
MSVQYPSDTQHPQSVPPEEEGILNYFLDIRNFLGQLKQNRTRYLDSKKIQATYGQVLSKVRELDNIRKNNRKAPSTSATTLIHSAELHNRVDSVLDDVFQLISLCFLTVGLKNSAPAAYASLSTVQRLLEHLNESNVFTMHDLRPIKERLTEIKKIVEKSCEQNTEAAKEEEEYVKNTPDLNETDKALSEEKRKNKIEEDLLLRAKLQHCLDEYHATESKVEEIDPSLTSIMDKLFQIRRELLSLAASAKDTTVSIAAQKELEDKHVIAPESVSTKVESLRKELSEVESHRDENGKFKSLETGKVAEKGQNVLNGLLDDCNDLISDLSHQKNGGIELDPKLQPIYAKLIDIKTTLENLLITRRWTLRETDLFTYQKQLGEIDNMRVNNKFPTSTGDNKGQSILLYLLRRCYAIIYKLLESSEPVSESLQPLHNQLSTVRRCLLSLKRMGGVNNPRELYPYQMKLASLDALRVDGKFYDSDGNIPEGQATLNALLAECFDILHEMKVESDERSESGSQSGSQSESPSDAEGDDDDDNLRETYSEAERANPRGAKYLDNEYTSGDDDDDEDDDDDVDGSSCSEHSFVDDDDVTTSSSAAKD